MAAKIVRPTDARSGFARCGESAAMLAALVFICSVTLRSDTLPLLLPQLKPGQSLLYEVHGRLNRSVKTESLVSRSFGPQQLQGDLSSQIRLSVQKVSSGKPHPTATLQTELLPTTSVQSSSPSPPIQKLTFDIFGSGQLGNVKGLDTLSPEQLLLYQFCVPHFAFSCILPPNHLTLAKKSKF